MEGGVGSGGAQRSLRPVQPRSHVFGDTEGSLLNPVAGGAGGSAGVAPVSLQLLSGSTSLSQATGPGQTQAPFLPLPSLMPETTDVVASGPGSRVAGDLLAGRRAAELTNRRWTLAPGAPAAVAAAHSVAGLDPLLNGRNLQLRFHSSGPVALATLAAHGEDGKAPSEQHWLQLLKDQHEQQGAPTHPTGQQGQDHLLGERCSDRQQLAGAHHRPGQPVLAAPTAPISWPIGKPGARHPRHQPGANRGTQKLYPGTAWAATATTGVEYDLTCR